MLSQALKRRLCPGGSRPRIDRALACRAGSNSKGLGQESHHQVFTGWAGSALRFSIVKQ